MNAIYLVSRDVLQTLRIRGRYQWLLIPNDPQERCVLIVRHSDDANQDELVATPGVQALPDPLSNTPIGQDVASAMAPMSSALTSAPTGDLKGMVPPVIDPTDTTYALLEKLRAVWPMARIRWAS